MGGAQRERAPRADCGSGGRAAARGGAGGCRGGYSRAHRAGRPIHVRALAHGAGLAGAHPGGPTALFVCLGTAPPSRSRPLPCAPVAAAACTHARSSPVATGSCLLRATATNLKCQNAIHRQVWFGAVIGVVPFVIGAYEFTKRIVSPPTRVDTRPALPNLAAARAWRTACCRMSGQRRPSRPALLTRCRSPCPAPPLLPSAAHPAAVQGVRRARVGDEGQVPEKVSGARWAKTLTRPNGR